MIKKIIFTMLVFMVISVVVAIITFKWIDEKTLPLSTDARNILRLTAATYPYVPADCDRTCVQRAIKISNLLILTNYGSKEIHDIANDMGASYRLLTGVLSSRDMQDEQGRFYVSLERLVVLNRMSAMAIGYGKRLDKGVGVDVDNWLHEKSFDDVSNDILKREKVLFDILNKRIRGNEIDDSLLEFNGDEFRARFSRMLIGAAMCAVQEPGGDEVLRDALQSVKDQRSYVIFSLTRDFDLPLLLAAKLNSECLESIIEVEMIVGR